MSYLQLLHHRHGHRLAQEVGHLRLARSPAAVAASPGGGAPFLARLHLGLSRDLSPAETQAACAGWASYGPFDRDRGWEVRERSCRELGTARHSSSYLEAVRTNPRR